MSTQEQFASFLPENADQSGYLDGVQARIASVRATSFDYNGTLSTPVPAIAVVYEPEGGKETTQHYTVGKPDHRIPSDDGLRFKTFGGKKGLPKDSNGLAIVMSLINAGFPVDRLGSGDDLSVFDNTIVKLRSEAQPKREGQETARTIVLVDQIVTLPWENTAGTKKAAGKPATTTGAKPTGAKPATAAKPAAAAPVAAGSPINDEDAKQAALETVVKLLETNETIAKAKLGPLSFRLLSNNPNRLNATKLLTTGASEFLPTLAEAGIITFDGETISAAA
jgi:hypothetical protein